MEQIEILTEIATAMVEFTKEKSHSKSFSGDSVSIRFENPNTKAGQANLDKFLIETVAENILDISFEINLVIRITKSLFETYYGYKQILNTLYQKHYFDGKDLVEKVKVLSRTTRLDLKTATKSVLEIYYTETLTKAINFLRDIQAKVDAGETHPNHPQNK